MSEKVKARIEAIDEEPRSDPEGHLSIETLSAYHRRVLSPGKSAKVRSHVVLCPACRALLLDLARFLDDTAGLCRLSPEEVTAAWQRLQKTGLKAGAR
jgi:hypothetical protein